MNQQLIHHLTTRTYRQMVEDAITALQLKEQLIQFALLPDPDQRSTLLSYPGTGAIPNLFTDKDLPAWEASARTELRHLLPTSCYLQARSAILNQHHTDPRLVPIIWNALSALGFVGGSVLDPGCSIGMFEEFMPANLRGRVRVIGVEPDSNTAEIFRLLHPLHIQRLTTIQQYLQPHNVLDAAIGNPAFSDGVFETYNKSSFRVSLASYIICKSIDLLKPGGLLAMIVGTGVLDSVGNNDHQTTFRKWVNHRAVFLGSVRVPMGTFVPICRCHTSADIIFFQKRVAGDKRQSEPFIQSQLYPDIVSVKTGDPVRLNEFYQAYPEYLLGTPALCKLTGDRFALAWEGDDASLFETIQGAVNQLIQKQASVMGGINGSRAS